MSLTISQLASLLGIIFGTAGLVISILNYLRGRPKVRVHLSWDMESVGNPMLPNGKKMGLVKVTNTGRRPVYVSHAALVLPKEKDEKTNQLLLLTDSIAGDKLAEGDPPQTYQIGQDNLSEYAEHWDEMYVQIEDSTGTQYTSQKYVGPAPSWAEEYEENNETPLSKRIKRNLRRWWYSLPFTK